VDNLQFQKAEFADPRAKCRACQSPLSGNYFQFAGAMICPACATRVQSAQAEPDHSGLIRGTLFGLGAAVACAVGYATILVVTGFELALVSIAVGYLVGRAVRIGSHGLGGRRCQAIAVVLTYLAITISYLPLLLKNIEATSAQIAGAIVPLLGIALAYPFLQLQDGIGGILGIAIIAFGLLQAWRQTARDRRVVTGPFTLAETA
jgi:hypothetical protein